MLFLSSKTPSSLLLSFLSLNYWPLLVGGVTLPVKFITDLWKEASGSTMEHMSACSTPQADSEFSGNKNCRARESFHIGVFHPYPRKTGINPKTRWEKFGMCKSGNLAFKFVCISKKSSKYTLYLGGHTVQLCVSLPNMTRFLYDWFSVSQGAISGSWGLAMLS